MKIKSQILFVVHKCHTTNPTERNEAVWDENLLTAAKKYSYV